MTRPRPPFAQFSWRSCLVLFVIVAAAALPPAAAWGQSQALTEEVNAWLDALQGDDLLAAERAAQQLAVSNAYQAVPRLIEIFAASDTPRLPAIALGGIGATRATQVLASALADEDLTPRRNAAQIGLLYGGEAAIQTLIASLTAPRPATRRHAAELLGYLGSPTALNGLVRAAHQDSDASVRQAAVWALSQIDAPRVRPTLVEISVRDPDPDVRAEADRALQSLSTGVQ
jgi:HEAT repeat protein